MVTALSVLPSARAISSALRQARAKRLTDEFNRLQDYRSKAAKARGVLSEEDLDRYLRE